MSIQPLITFKAGKCEADFSASPPKVKPVATPGFLYLYNEEELVHFCWRARDASLSDPELDLVMVPTDGTFRPYTGPNKIAAGAPVKSPLNGRIFVLKFSSSSQRHLFWLQSREQPAGDPSKFSQRDLRLGEIVDNLLQGEEMDVEDIEELRHHRGGDGGDGDISMEDVQGAGAHGSQQGSGPPANPSGSSNGTSRGGGGEGGRANQDAVNPPVDLHQLLASIRSGGSAGGAAFQQQQLSTTLPDLLPPQHTVPALASAPIEQIDRLLLHHLPVQLLEHATGQKADPAVQASELLTRLSESRKRELVTRVLRSPQFTQALSSTTSALRDGGLPGVSEALGVRVKNGGWTGPGAGQGQPLTGGAAIEAFIEGAKGASDEEPRRG